MRKIISILSVSLIVFCTKGECSTRCGTGILDSIPPGYKLVWSDEFTGNGLPDQNNWSFELGLVRNHEDQWYQIENAISLYIDDQLLNKVELRFEVDYVRVYQKKSPL